MIYMHIKSEKHFSIWSCLKLLFSKLAHSKNKQTNKKYIWHRGYTHTHLLISQIKVSQNNTYPGASLVAQWLGVCLLMQETRVRALVWEDPTCRGATTEPVSHNY